VVAFYGTPLGPGLGILGRYDITTTLALLTDQVQTYRDLDPTVETVPAFHMVVTIADGYAGEDGDYNHRVPTDTIRLWIDGARAAGAWVFLDLQVGGPTWRPNWTSWSPSSGSRASTWRWTRSSS